MLKDMGSEVSVMMTIDVDAHFLSDFCWDALLVGAALQIPVVFLILMNGTYGALRWFAEVLKGDAVLDDFRNTNPAIDVWIRLSLKPN